MHMRNLKEAEVSEMRAGPGWLIVDLLDTEDTKKSAGGLHLPQMHARQVGLMKYAVVVSCGEFFEPRCGAQRYEGWPLEKGTVICFHPHSEWSFSNIDTSMKLLAIKCTDVLAVVPRQVVE